MAATTEGGVQTWVSQLAALTSQKMAKEEDGPSLSKEPPQGLSRKRPGTGRKLPSIPTNDRSPVSSENSSYLGDQAELFVANIPSTRAGASRLLVNGKNSTAVSTATSANGKAVRISSHPGERRGGKSNGHSMEAAESSVGSSHISTRSRGSRGSVDTKLLLQDTETVMAAMESRLAYKSGRGDRQSSSGADGGDSDTDVSSTVALANGDDNYVKPTLFKSPRDALFKRQQRADLTNLGKTKSGVSSPASTSSSGKKSIGRSYSQTIAPKAGSVQSPRSVTSVTSAGGTRRTLVSDVLSRKNSLYNDSIISDVSSDGRFLRSASKAKGTISMTKPNRAFQLRRARADSVEEPPATLRSARSTASSKYSTSGASARSSSVHSTGRRSDADTRRSDVTAASLGGQIVRKSRQNSTQEKTKTNPNLSHGDDGRHILKLQRASSLAQANVSQASPAIKRDLGIKSPIRPAGSRGNLSITGTSSSASRSQPGSRSNSPKAAERMAWKRRKEYDPRKAVAEAKAKSKDKTGGTASSKPSASSSYNRCMIRSASFTNPQDLALSVQNSLSSRSQDFSMASTPNSDHYYSDGPRRAFVPFQNSPRTGRSAHSADEDDSILSNNSAQETSQSLISLSRAPPHNSLMKSAFTPPLVIQSLSKLTPPQTPPSLSSSLSTSLSLRRRTIHTESNNGYYHGGPIVENGHSLDNHRYCSEGSPPQASYDTLIVSSVYQLSLKLKTSMDKTLDKLREQDRVSLTPSPIDDFLSDYGRCEIPAWKSANQELAGVLKNLRNIERHVQIMNQALFPDEDTDTEVGTGMRTGQEKQRYVKEIERIRNEIKGFQPIQPHNSEVASPEMAELDEQF